MLYNHTVSVSVGYAIEGLTIDFMQLPALEVKVAILDDVVIELVPGCNRSKLWARKA